MLLSAYLGVAAIILWTISAQAETEGGGAADAIGGVIGCLFWLGLIGGVFYYFYNKRKPFQLTAQTGLSPQDAIRTAVQTYTMDGWQVTSQTPDNATFCKTRKPSCLIAGVLLLLGLVPGILYLFFAGGTINAYAHATQNAGTTTLQVRGTASGWGAKSSGERVIQTARAPQGLSGGPQQANLPPA